MKPDFFYECLTCKCRIPASWGNVNPDGMQSVTVAVPKKKDMTETTFRCKDHHEQE